MYFLSHEYNRFCHSQLVNVTHFEREDGLCARKNTNAKKKKIRGDMLAIFVLINNHGIFYCNLIAHLQRLSLYSKVIFKMILKTHEMAWQAQFSFSF